MSLHRLERLLQKLSTEPTAFPDVTPAALGRSVSAGEHSDRADAGSDRIVAALVRKLDSTDTRAALAAESDLLAVGISAGRALLRALPDCRWAVRARIARVLGKLGHPNAIPGLRSLFDQAQPRYAAGWLFDPEQADTFYASERAETLAEWLDVLEESGSDQIDRPVYTQLQVVGALYAIRGPEAIAAFGELFDCSRPEIQRVVALMLRALAQEQPGPALRSALPPLRRGAARGAGGSSRSRRECRLAIEAIERITVASAQLPVPAAPPEPAAQSLPRAHPHRVDEPPDLPIHET